MSIEKHALFIQIAHYLKELIAQSDITVFVLYDPNLGKESDPVDYKIGDSSVGFGNIPLDFAWNGIGVWYIINRNNDEFKAIKILAVMKDGHFQNGQVGDYEGYWEEFSSYIADDQWVQNIMNSNIANFNGSIPKSKLQFS